MRSIFRGIGQATGTQAAVAIANTITNATVTEVRKDLCRCTAPLKFAHLMFACSRRRVLRVAQGLKYP